MARDLWERPTFVYRAFGTNGRLLYVGISDNWRARLRGHEKSSDWWAYVIRVDAELYESRHQAFAVESWALRYESPLWNSEEQWRWVPFILPRPIEKMSKPVTRFTWSGNIIPPLETPDA